MGIRIKKSLGYGLDLSKVEGLDYEKLHESISDFCELSNEEAYQKLYDGVNEFDPDNKTIELHFVKLCGGNVTPYRHVIYDEEFGDKNILQFTPAKSGKDEGWYRRDDPLDYYEYSNRYGWDDLAPRIDWLDEPIYPYVNLMKKNQELPFGIEKYWIPIYKEVDPNGKHVPYVPLHIMVTMKLLNFVPEEKLVDTFMMLRPCIYTYWS